MRRSMLFLAICLAFVTSCTISNAAQPTSTDLHGQWVEYITRNEQSKAAQIVSPSAYPQFATDFAAMQSLLQSGQYGSLTEVTINPPHPNGSTEVARSIWEFGKAKRCYDTEIAQVGWDRKIIGWRSVSCLS